MGTAYLCPGTSARPGELSLEAGLREMLARAKRMSRVEALVGRHGARRQPRSSHEIPAESLEGLHLRSGCVAGLEIADKADADGGPIPGVLFYVPPVLLLLPAPTDVDLAVLRLARAIGNNEVVGEAIAHTTPLVYLVNIECVIDIGGAVMNDDSLPFPRRGPDGIQLTFDASIE